MHTLEREIEAILPHCTAPFILSVSGGRDSMVLLELFRRLALRGSLSAVPVVFHLNHGLRPDASLDEALVARAAAAADLAYYYESADTRAFAIRSGMGLEEAGRHLRYRALWRLCREWPGSVAVTAHHADDYLETVLAHLIRGAGSSALATMPLTGRIFGIEVLRPLLIADRARLSRIATDCGIEFREDSTNQDEAFQRNRLRARVTPELRQQGLDPVRLWRQEHEAELGSRVPRRVKPPHHVALDRRMIFSGLSSSIKRTLDAAASALELAPVSASVVLEVQRAITDFEDFRLNLHCRDYCLWSARTGAVWVMRLDSPFLRSPVFEQDDAVQGLQEQSRLTIRYGDRERTYLVPAGTKAAAGSVAAGLAGARVGLPGGGTKKLKKVLQEARIPGPVRPHLPVLVEPGGLVRQVCFGFWEDGVDRHFGAPEGFARLESSIELDGFGRAG